MSKSKSLFTIIKQVPKESVTIQATSSKVRSIYLYCSESTLNLKNVLGNSILEVYINEKYKDSKILAGGQCERSIFLIKTEEGYIRFSSLSTSSIIKIN